MAATRWWTCRATRSSILSVLVGTAGVRRVGAGLMAATCCVLVVARFCRADSCCCRRNSAAPMAEGVCGAKVILVRCSCSSCCRPRVLGWRHSGLEATVAGLSGPVCLSAAACWRCCLCSHCSLAIWSSTLSLSTRTLLRGASG